MARQYDLRDDSVVVVIGSGAGGGTLSNELAQKGVDVVCLEAGGRLSFSDIVNDPPLMDQRMGWHDERRGGAGLAVQNGWGDDHALVGRLPTLSRP